MVLASTFHLSLPLQPPPTVADQLWPYLPTLERLALAIALGLFVGLERERRGKEAGLRTFGFCALLGALGGLLGDAYALAALALVGLLALLLNLHRIRTGATTELTTSAALFVTTFVGILCGMGHTLTPTAVGVATAALLAWKGQLSGLSASLTEGELRSAILLAVLTFIVYPALPVGTVDPWGLIQPRAVWLTVILIAGLGFVNYVLLKLYGARAVELTGLLGGLVNSTATVAELASRDRDAAGGLSQPAYRGVVLATGAMAFRNAVLLAILAPPTLLHALGALVVMMGVSAALAHSRRPSGGAGGGTTVGEPLSLGSPFSIGRVLSYGAMFLAFQVMGALAEREAGHLGFYAVAFLGGLVSSATSVASAGALAAHGALTATVAANGAVLALLASAAINLPVMVRLSHDRVIGRRLTWAIALVLIGGTLGWVAEIALLAK